MRFDFVICPSLQLWHTVTVQKSASRGRSRRMVGCILTGIYKCSRQDVVRESLGENVCSQVCKGTYLSDNSFSIRSRRRLKQTRVRQL